MIGGTTNNGLPTYTRKYLTDLGITANFGSINDDLGTSAIDAGVLMFLFWKTLLVGSIICTLIPLLFQQEPQSQIHFFFSKATDKTNNPTYCYTFTPTGVAQETSYADYWGR
jgi:hypothetical protein